MLSLLDALESCAIESEDYCGDQGGSNVHKEGDDFLRKSAKDIDISSLLPEYEMELNEQVYQYYADFRDTTEPIYSYPTELTPRFCELGKNEQKFLEYCLRECMSSKRCEAAYQLLLDTKDEYEEEGSFENAAAFAAYAAQMKQLAVAKQKWCTAVIKKGGYEIRSGVLRDIPQLVSEILEQSGGIDSIIRVEEEVAGSFGVKSNPMNSRAAVVFDMDQAVDIPTVYFSLFVDATTMSKSGSQSKNIVRLRLDGIRGQRDTWHEIGICPSLPKKMLDSASTAAQSEMRAEVFHRFLFLLLKSSIESCRTGAQINGRLVALRLLMIVCDQPQERLLLALKNVGSFRDCSFCELVTRVAKECINARSSQIETGGQASSHGQDTVQDDIRDNRGETGFEMQPDVSTSATRVASERNPERTIEAALVASKPPNPEAPHSIRFNKRQQQLSEVRANQYLKSMSANPFPPAIAAFPGMSSGVARLYKTIAFDALHVMDLGLLREIPERTCEVFSTTQYAQYGRKATLIRIVNQRFVDIPAGSSVPRRSIFLMKKSDVQAGMTGKIRRQSLPFLWVVLMGMNPSRDPDDDSLIQCALLMNHVYSKMAGINQHRAMQRRYWFDIAELETDCCRLGHALISTFGIKMSTKIHRIASHVGDHLRDFGDFYFGSTGENELIHKDTKGAYVAAYKHGDTLAKQLLNNRVGAEEFQTAAHIQKRRKFSVRHESERIHIVPRVPDEKQTWNQVVYEKEKYIAETAHKAMETSMQPSEHVMSVLSDIRKPLSGGKLFRILKRTSIRASFSWMHERPLQHIFCQSRKPEGNSRIDFVAYTETYCPEYSSSIINDAEHPVQHGQLVAILQSGNTHKLAAKVVVVRKMQPCAPASGNKKVVEEFGFTRLEYTLNEVQDFSLAVIPLSQVLHRVCVVPDMHWVSKKYGIQRRLNEPFSSKTERAEAKFFVIPIKVSSFGGIN